MTLTTAVLVLECQILWNHRLAEQKQYQRKREKALEDIRCNPTDPLTPVPTTWVTSLPCGTREAMRVEWVSDRVLFFSFFFITPPPPPGRETMALTLIVERFLLSFCRFWTFGITLQPYLWTFARSDSILHTTGSEDYVRWRMGLKPISTLV